MVGRVGKEGLASYCDVRKYNFKGRKLKGTWILASQEYSRLWMVEKLLHDELIFDMIYFEDFQYEGNITTGTVTKLIGDDSTKIIQLHDNPCGNMNLMAFTAARAIFDLSEEVTPSEIEGGVLVESDDGGNETTGMLRIFFIRVWRGCGV